MSEEKKNNKVILFPKLKERLQEQGMQFLHNKNYKDALDTFYELCHLYHEMEKSSEVQIGIVVCLLELGQYDEAKKNCKRLLNEDIGDYYDILQIYISILIQVQEYGEAVAIIEAITHEKQLPSDRAEHFFQLLDFCRRMQDQKVQAADENLDVNLNSLDDLDRKVEALLESSNPGQQIQLLNEIRPFDISYLLPFMRDALVNRSIHPAVKTVILQICLEKQVKDTLEVEKFDNIKKVCPMNLDQVFERDFSVKVLRCLEDHLEMENPTLYDIVRQLWEQFLFIVYPFDVEPEKEKTWAAALYKIGYDLHGIEIILEDVCVIFNVLEAEVTNVIEKINKIDHYSFY